MAITMSEREPLPPAPRDDWGRFHAERGSFGSLLWVRPSHLVEIHPSILHLQPRDAVDELFTWERQPWGGRDFLLGLHRHAFGAPWTLEASGAWEQVLRDLQEAFTSGWLVLHAERPPPISPGREPVPPGVLPRPPTSPTTALTWVEIVVLEAGSLSPVPNEPVRLVDPRGVPHDLRTDRGGVARLGGLDPGVCEVTFPAADGREWTRAGTRFLIGRDDVRAVHEVQARQCMARIAHLHGFRSGLTLWDHGVNADLRALRKTPDVLCPGDRVNVLVREERVDEARTTMRHTYWLKPSGRWLRVILHEAFGEPLRDAEVTVLLDRGEHVVTMTQPDGMLVVPLPSWAETVTIVTPTYRWPVALADLRPVENVPDGGRIGARIRLANLGVRTSSGSVVQRAASSASERHAGEESEFDADVWGFQRSLGLRDTGRLDLETVAAVVRSYGH